MEIKLEFIGMDTVGTFNVVEEVDHVLLFKVFNDSVTTVLFNSVTAGLGLLEIAKGNSVECGAIVLFTGFKVLNHTLILSLLGINNGFLGMSIAVGGCRIKGVGSVGIGMRLLNSVMELVYSSNPSCATVGSIGLLGKPDTSVFSSGLGSSDVISKLREVWVFAGATGKSGDGNGGSGGRGGAGRYGRLVDFVTFVSNSVAERKETYYTAQIQVHVK